jgi:hypothetical protein
VIDASGARAEVGGDFHTERLVRAVRVEARDEVVEASLLNISPRHQAHCGGDPEGLPKSSGYVGGSFDQASTGSLHAHVDVVNVLNQRTNSSNSFEQDAVTTKPLL